LGTESWLDLKRREFTIARAKRLKLTAPFHSSKLDLRDQVLARDFNPLSNLMWFQLFISHKIGINSSIPSQLSKEEWIENKDTLNLNLTEESHGLCRRSVSFYLQHTYFNFKLTRVVCQLWNFRCCRTETATRGWNWIPGAPWTLFWHFTQTAYLFRGVRLLSIPEMDILSQLSTRGRDDSWKESAELRWTSMWIGNSKFSFLSLVWNWGESGAKGATKSISISCLSLSLAFSSVLYPFLLVFLLKAPTHLPVLDQRSRHFNLLRENSGRRQRGFLIPTENKRLQNPFLEITH